MAPPQQVHDAVEASARWHAVDHVDEVGSTNAELADRARDRAPSGLVLVTDHQTAGRGRLDRAWEDIPGRSLLVSFLVDLGDARLAPLAVGLALADAIALVGPAVALKWPNDVLLGGRKCAGVLIESVPTPTGPRTVIGTGINVDWRDVERTDETAAWTSIAEAVDRDVDRWTLLVHLLGSLDRWLTELDLDPAGLVDRYRERCTTIGAEVAVTVGDGVVSGTATDVADDGGLAIRTGERTLTVLAGDVTHVRSVPPSSQG